MCSVKKGVLKNFAISTGKYTCIRFSLIKLQAFNKKRLRQNVSLWILRYLRTPILKHICERLHLHLK